MQFLELFEKPTEAFVRGEAVLGRRTGEVLIEPYSNFNTATLSPTVVNPKNLKDFACEIVWSSPEEGQIGLTIYLGREYEWSILEDSPFKISIEKDGSIVVSGCGLKSIELDEKVESRNGERFIRFGKKDSRLTVSVSGKNYEFDWASETGKEGGFLTFQSSGTFVRLKRFEISSPHDFPPLTIFERKKAIEEYLKARSAQNKVDFEKIAVFIKNQKENGDWGYSTDIAVYPGLVKPGEPVKVIFRRSDRASNQDRVWIEGNYLSDGSRNISLAKLEWNLCDGWWEASFDFTPEKPGNYKVVWQTPDETLTRVFAAVESGYAVCTLWVGSNFPIFDKELHKYSLPGDYWIGDWWSPFGTTPEAVLDYMRPYAEMRHKYGDRLVPFVNAQFIAPGSMDFNLQDLDEETQAKGLSLIKELWNALEIGPLEIVGSYTLGHDTARILKKLDVKAINSLCTWQNWIDGHPESGWKINHMGAPNVPYYVADDDFRKVSAKKSIVASSMGTATSVRQYCIFTMEGAPTLTCPMQRYTDNTAQSVNMTRFYDAVEGWLRDADYQDEPVFFTVGLENFLGKADWREANAKAIEYLVEQAKTRKLVFASLADIAEYYHTHYEQQPENIFYQPDIYCGYRCENKPAQLPDRIEISNSLFHSLHNDGQALPQFIWNFTEAWDNPEWRTDYHLRDSFGLIAPERYEWHSTVPRQMNLDGVKVDVEGSWNGDTYKIIINIETDKKLKFLPIAIWKIPIDFSSLKIVDIEENCRLIKVKDWTTGNTHVVAVVENLPDGILLRQIMLGGKIRQPKSAEKFLFGCLRCRTIEYLNGSVHTYIWRADGVDEARMKLEVPSGKQFEARYNDGSVVIPDKYGAAIIEICKDWRKEVPVICGLTGEDILKYGKLLHSK